MTKYLKTKTNSIEEAISSVVLGENGFVVGKVKMPKMKGGAKLQSKTNFDFRLFDPEDSPGSDKANDEMNREIVKASKMKDKATAMTHMNKIQKKHSKHGATDTEPREVISQVLNRVFGESVELGEGYEANVMKILKRKGLEGAAYFKNNNLMVSKRDFHAVKKALRFDKIPMTPPKIVVEDVELDEDERMKKLTKRQRQALARIEAQPKSKVSLPKMPDFMKPKKEEVEININEKTEYVEYKFKNRGDAMKAKRYFDGIQLMDFDVNDDNISNGELMVDAGNRDMTRYHKEIVKKFSPKVMKTEVYEIGNDYAKHTLEVTPGQSRDDVDEMLGIAQKKRTSMREALAKMWGLDEGKNPFEKSEKKDLTKEGEHDKTLTGKKPTKVEVDPELKDK